MGILRRNLILGVVSSMCLLSAPAYAITTAEGESFIDTALTELTAMVNMGKSGPALQPEINRFFAKYSSVPVVARTVLGAPWRGMSQSQRDAYVKAFNDYAVRKYSGLFEELRGGTPRIEKSWVSGDAAIVRTVYDFPRSRPVIVEFTVADIGSSPKVISFSLDNVSIIATERLAIRLMFSNARDDVNSFIATLKSK